ncbi:MAG: hypothetical protein M3450_06035 [Actinomycetota bacterium]|nr:hypothetical protein [Actinomycetota bacterium]
MISPYRLGQVVLAADGHETVVAWVEGGGAPILSVRSPMGLQDAGEWALAEDAVGVVTRRIGEEQAYWWGPGAEAPFNKADLLPLRELHHRPPHGRTGWRSDLWSAELGAGYPAFWTDRAWSSLHPDLHERTRRLFEGELQEILVRAHIAGSPDAEEVEVNRYDMFLEGPPHLRGMIRNRHIESLQATISDGEDAVNPNFHAGPPHHIDLEPIG